MTTVVIFVHLWEKGEIKVMKKEININREDLYEYDPKRARTKRRLKQMKDMGLVEVGIAEFGVEGVVSGLYIEKVWNYEDEKFQNYLAWMQSVIDRKKEQETICKCGDPDPYAGNSDAECFTDPEYEDYYDGNDYDDLRWFERAEQKVRKNPKLCDICVYNKKFKGWNWDQWEKFRKEIGKEPRH